VHKVLRVQNKVLKVRQELRVDRVHKGLKVEPQGLKEHKE